MYCNHCGMNNPDGTMYCARCGNRLTSVQILGSRESSKPATDRWKLIEYYRNAAAEAGDDKQVVEELSQFVCGPNADSCPSSYSSTSAIPGSQVTGQYPNPAQNSWQASSSRYRRAAPDRRRAAPSRRSGYEAQAGSKFTSPSAAPSSKPVYGSHYKAMPAAAKKPAKPAVQPSPAKKKLPKRVTPDMSVYTPSNPSGRSSSYTRSSSNSYIPRHNSRARKRQIQERVKMGGIVCLTAIGCVGLFFLTQFVLSKAFPAQSKSTESTLSTVISQDPVASFAPSSAQESDLPDVPSSEQVPAVEESTKPSESADSSKNAPAASSTAPSEQEPPVDKPDTFVQRQPYRVNVPMNLRSAPNLNDDSILFMLGEGETIQIVERFVNPEYPDLVWGKLDTGQYVCLEDPETIFCEVIQLEQ